MMEDIDRATMLSPAKDPAYQRDIKAIHAMRRELALSEDCYRAILSRISGGRVETSSSLTPPERSALKAEFRRLGAGKKAPGKCRAAKPASEPRPLKPANSRQQAMIRALWLELAGLGAINDAGEDALASYVLRQAKVDALQFVTSDAAEKVLGGLKGWLRRIKKERGIA